MLRILRVPLITAFMDELETAVLVCLNPVADESVKKQALQYCQNIRTSPEGWAFVLQHLVVTRRPEVAFWCCQVLHEKLSDSSKYPVTLSSDHVILLRSKLLDYFTKVSFPDKYQNGSTQDVFPSYLLNKIAQLLTAMVAADYPLRWPEAFSGTILPLVKPSQNVTESSIAMFFRALRSLDDDIISVRASQLSEEKRIISIRVKDAMRDDCIAEIINTCCDLLSSAKFVSYSFDIISRYVEWVDIGLIAQDRILRPMYSAITSGSECLARPAAASALRSIILKRMDRTAKVSLLKALKIETLLQSIPADNLSSSDDEQGDPDLPLLTGQVEVASLVNTIAMTALDALKESLKGNNTPPLELQAQSFVASVAQLSISLALRLMDEDAEEGTSSQTLQCVSTFVNVFAKAIKSGSTAMQTEGMAAISSILAVVEDRALFPEDYDPHDDKSDSHRSLSELRNVLLKSVFRSIVRSFPHLCVEFVKRLFVKASEARGIPRTELAMTALLILTSTVPEQPQVNELRRQVIASPPHYMDFSSDVRPTSLNSLEVARHHQLEVISVAYFDLVARSYRLFLTRGDPALLSLVLPVFFDGRGLGHKTSEMVRSQAAHSLLKLARPLRSVVTSSLLEAVLNAARVHLLPLILDVNSQGSKNQMLLFETVGYLLGTDHKRSDAIQYLSAILQPLVEGLQQNPGIPSVAYIAACGRLSKGFGGDSKPLLLIVNDSDSQRKDVNTKAANGYDDSSGKEVKVQRVTPLSEDLQRIWVVCLDAVLKASALSFEPNQDLGVSELRLKLMFFLHRMVDTVGGAVLPYLQEVLPRLLTSSESPQKLRDVIILTSQAITKFGDSFEDVAVRVYLPIVEGVHKHSYSLDPNTLTALSEESREAVEMHRAYTYFLHAITSSSLIRLLVHPSHQHVLQGIMTSLLSTVVGESLDVRVAASVVKMSLHMLSQMVEKWIGQPGSQESNRSPPGFSQFVLEKVSSATVACGVRGSLFRTGDYGSGQAIAVLTEIVAVQKTCATHLGRPFAEALLNDALRTLPKAGAEAYLTALYSSDTAVPTLVAGLSQLLRLLRAG